jgi:hypothetical protein
LETVLEAGTAMLRQNLSRSIAIVVSSLSPTMQTTPQPPFAVALVLHKEFGLLIKISKFHTEQCTHLYTCQNFYLEI